MVQQLDPEGKDSALRKMVVIGHSQGGLLTKLTAIDSRRSFMGSSIQRPSSIRSTSRPKHANCCGAVSTTSPCRLSTASSSSRRPTMAVTLPEDISASC
ncbi:MAG: hypothetical protein MZU91_01465 [Desulfosudis oleivorans]|nr:hypothetical protein [Desulfosudis oleivorans]